MDFSLVLSAERERGWEGECLVATVCTCILLGIHSVQFSASCYIIIMAKPLVLIIQWNPSKVDTIGTTTVCWNIWGNLYFRGFQNISDRCGNAVEHKDIILWTSPLP